MPPPPARLFRSLGRGWNNDFSPDDLERGPKGKPSNCKGPGKWPLAEFFRPGPDPKCGRVSLLYFSRQLYRRRIDKLAVDIEKVCLARDQRQLHHDGAVPET